ncbi:hypothetical protein ACOKM5_20855 [Streptomyces sp. BH097]|uniref:hypothetical protein n=1 Tax=Streptomyces sp. BH097 TaxID=3410406 RepID=UPI003CF2E0DA
MTAYSDVFRALTSGRALRPAEASRLLAALHDEHAAELAEVIRGEAKKRCAPADTDSRADARKKRRRFGGMFSAASLIDPAHRRATMPNQRDRSTS